MVLQRHDDLAEVLVGFHVPKCRSDLVELADLVDRQQLAGFDRAPDVLADFVKNLSDFVDAAGAEGDADSSKSLTGNYRYITIVP
jgi:hypothetical protein